VGKSAAKQRRICYEREEKSESPSITTETATFMKFITAVLLLTFVTIHVIAALFS